MPMLLGMHGTIAGEKSFIFCLVLCFAHFVLCISVGVHSYEWYIVLSASSTRGCIYGCSVICFSGENVVPRNVKDYTRQWSHLSIFIDSGYSPKSFESALRAWGVLTC